MAGREGERGGGVKTTQGCGDCLLIAQNTPLNILTHKNRPKKCGKLFCCWARVRHCQVQNLPAETSILLPPLRHGKLRRSPSKPRNQHQLLSGIRYGAQNTAHTLKHSGVGLASNAQQYANIIILIIRRYTNYKTEGQYMGWGGASRRERHTADTTYPPPRSPR